MAKVSEFELKVVESRKNVTAPEARDGVAVVDVVANVDEVLDSLKATKGAEKVLKAVPDLEKLDIWTHVAHFSVCQKTGTAQFLDVWDCDLFDGFTDLQRCLNDCRVWFSGDGYDSWGSGQTKSGRVNCYFRAPTAGTYVCYARLQSHPATTTAVVECLIDNNSFGPLPFTGTKSQPHVANLSAGGHHFRIRQLTGSFFFLSLTVWKIG